MSQAFLVINHFPLESSHSRQKNKHTLYLPLQPLDLAYTTCETSHLDIRPKSGKSFRQLQVQLPSLPTLSHRVMSPTQFLRLGDNLPNHSTTSYTHLHGELRFDTQDNNRQNCHHRTYPRRSRTLRFPRDESKLGHLQRRVSESMTQKENLLHYMAQG